MFCTHIIVFGLYISNILALKITKLGLKNNNNNNWDKAHCAQISVLVTLGTKTIVDFCAR